jgi:hypothetical protein
MSKSHKCTFEAPEISSWTLNVTHDEQSGIYWEDALFTPVVSPPFGKFIIGSTYLTAPAVKRSPWVKKQSKLHRTKSAVQTEAKTITKGGNAAQRQWFLRGDCAFSGMNTACQLNLSTFGGDSAKRTRRLPNPAQLFAAFLPHGGVGRQFHTNWTGHV